MALLLWAFNSGQTSRAIAQPIPVPAATTNNYWAGYVATQRGPFAGIQATWTVPRVTCSPMMPVNSTAYMWIGEGGYVNGFASPLIQAGTASDCLSGQSRYHAFFEWYPGIYATDFPMTLSPGDTVTARVIEDTTDHWVLSIHDDTSGNGGATSTFYHADTQSADVIVERPTLCDWSGCGQVNLARFGAQTFSNIHLWSQTGVGPIGDFKPMPVALVNDGSRHILAVPGKPGSLEDALSVIWRGGS